ncbi:MAG: TetR/AcrR family transcriptional regulator [Microbacterium sp.]
MAASGKRGPYKVGIERRKAIIEQATEAFASSGYYGGTMRDIAARVGVTPTALSRYFASKEELLIAVAEDALSRWRAYVDEVMGPDRRGLDYVRGIPRVIEYMEKNPGIARLIMMLNVEGAADGHPAHSYILERYRTSRESFARHIAEAVEDGRVPAFTPEQIVLEADQLAAALNGALMLTALRAGSTEAELRYTSAFEVFTAHIDATIGRWRATAALGG